MSIVDLLAGMAQLMSLPDWLLAPLQAENLIDALRLQVSEFASGEWLVLYAGVKRFLLKDEGGYWEGTYNLSVQSSSTGLEKTVFLHGKLTAPWFGKPEFMKSEPAPLGSSEWHCYLPELNLMLETEPPEKELPGLAQLMDADRSRLLMESVLRESGRLAPDHTIAACTPRVLSYKPGSRCTIRYELEYAPPDPLIRNPQLLIGKVYRKGSKAQNAYEGMLTLWHSPLADGSAVTIAEPIACLPDLKLMLQTTIPGESSLEDLLKSVIDRPNPAEEEKLYWYIRKTAAGLAAFHRSGASYGEHVELGERFAHIHELIHRLNVLLPEFNDAILPLLQRLENLAALFYPEDPAVPTHGTFNPEQVLIDGERIGFIDFDDYGMAEPALDVGLFRAAIKDTGMNAPFSSPTPSGAERLARLRLLDEIGDVFLSEYETHAAISRHRVALWEAADYLRNCLHYWIKVKPDEPDNALLILDEHLQNCEKDHLLDGMQR